MKKLGVILLFLAGAVLTQAQTGTIGDSATYISVNYLNGITINISKDHIVFVEAKNNEVDIITTITKLPGLDFTDFGYLSAESLRDYLSGISFKFYREVRHFTDGQLDTVYFYYGDDLQYYELYGQSGAYETKEYVTE